MEALIEGLGHPTAREQLLQRERESAKREYAVRAQYGAFGCVLSGQARPYATPARRAQIERRAALPLSLAERGRLRPFCTRHAARLRAAPTPRT